MRQFRKDMDGIGQYGNPKLEHTGPTTTKISQPSNDIKNLILTSWLLVEKNQAKFMKDMQQNNSPAFRKSIQEAYGLSNNN